LSHKTNSLIRKLFIEYLDDPKSRNEDAEIFLLIAKHEAVQGPLSLAIKVRDLEESEGRGKNLCD